MSFDRAIDIVLDLEGGYVDDPHDPGGRTKFGISQAAYPDMDIANLTREQAVTLYRQDYWNKCKCGLMPWPWSLFVFDCAVNQGVGTAIRILQRTLGLKDDGIVGPVTLDAVARASPDRALRYMVSRLMRYQALSTWDSYAAGWTYRLFKVVKEA